MVKITHKSAWQIFGKKELMEAIEEALKEIKQNPEQFEEEEEGRYEYILETISDGHGGIYTPLEALDVFGVNIQEYMTPSDPYPYNVDGALYDLENIAEEIAEEINEEIRKQFPEYYKEDGRLYVVFDTHYADGSYNMILVWEG